MLAVIWKMVEILPPPSSIRRLFACPGLLMFGKPYIHESRIIDAAVSRSEDRADVHERMNDE